MYFFFTPAFAAVIVIFVVWLRTLVANHKSKPMLEQIQDAQWEAERKRECVMHIDACNAFVRNEYAYQQGYYEKALRAINSKAHAENINIPANFFAPDDTTNLCLGFGCIELPELGTHYCAKCTLKG